MSFQTLAIVAGCGIAVLIVGPLVVIALPQRQPDPQRGMAVGLLMIVSLFGIVCGLLYAAALIWKIRWLVEIPAWGTICFGALVLANLIAYPIQKARNAARDAAAREAEQLRTDVDERPSE